MSLSGLNIAGDEPLKVVILKVYYFVVSVLTVQTVCNRSVCFIIRGCRVWNELFGSSAYWAELGLFPSPFILKGWVESWVIPHWGGWGGGGCVGGLDDGTHLRKVRRPDEAVGAGWMGRVCGWGWGWGSAVWGRERCICLGSSPPNLSDAKHLKRH